MDPIEYLQAILQLLNLVAGYTQGGAVEHAPFTIEHEVLFSRALLNSPIFGLAELYAYQQDTINAVQNVRLDTSSPHIGTITDVLDAIALLTPITLPEIPPPGYGPGDGPSTWPALIDVVQMCSLD